MTRRVLATVCLVGAVIACGVTLGAQASPARRILDAAFRQAYEAADWPKAIEAAERLTLAFPDDPMTHYQFAAVLARGGEVALGLDALARSAELGFDHPSLLQRDADLDALRDRPEFAAIATRISGNSARTLASFKAEAARARVLTYLPRGYTPARPAPLLIALHGSGGRAAETASVYRRVAQDLGAILVAPEGLTTSGRGFAWGRLEVGEFLVQRAIDETSARHSVDAARIVLAGFADGGDLALAFAGRRPDDIAGVVAMAAEYDMRVAPVSRDAGATFPRMVLIAGAQDPELVAIRASANRLEGAGVPVTLRLIDNLGRAVPPDADAVLREAFAFVFGS